MYPTDGGGDDEDQSDKYDDGDDDDDDDMDEDHDDQWNVQVGSMSTMMGSCMTKFFLPKHMCTYKH